MRHSNTQIQMFDLQKMVEQIEQGRLALPEFQRDFDWSDTDVRSLLVTVFSGWPAGSLLMLDSRQKLFRLRSFEGGPPLKNQIKYIVLDGQQRLTSLFHALSDVGDSIYAVRWDIARTDIEEAVVSYTRKAWDRAFPDIETLVSNKLIPVTALKSPTTFFDWRDRAIRTAPPETRDSVKEELTSSYTYSLSDLNDYEFPVVILDENTEAAAIARIFERVNRTGMKLGAFDLMVAKTFDPGWNLRDKWIGVQEEYPSVANYLVDDGMPLLQALAISKVTDIRQKAVLNLDKQYVQQSWDDVARTSAEAVSFLKLTCGAFQRWCLPYPSMLPLLIAASNEGYLQRNSTLFERWFWQTSLLNLYNAAANTRTVSHFESLTSLELPKTKTTAAKITLLGASRQGERASWAAYICFLYKKLISAGFDQKDLADLEVSSIYTKGEISDKFDEDFLSERDALNSILVPSSLTNVIRRMTSDEIVEFAHEENFLDLIKAQIGEISEDPMEMIVSRIDDLVEFLRALNFETARDDDVFGFFDWTRLPAEEQELA